MSIRCSPAGVRHLRGIVPAALAITVIGPPIWIAASTPPVREAAVAHAITGRDIIQAMRMVAVRMAPDGSRVLYETARADVDQNSRTLELWTVDAQGTEPPVRRAVRTRADAEPAAFGARWAPDGRSVSYLDADGGEQRVSSLSLATSASSGPTIDAQAVVIFSSSRLPAGSVIVSHEWSPDGRYIAVIVSSADVGAPAVVPPRVVSSNGTPSSGTTVSPLLPNGSPWSGTARGATSPSVAPPNEMASTGTGPTDLLPSGTAALPRTGFDIDDLRWPTRQSARARRVWILDRQTLSLEPLTPARLDVESVSWAPDSQRIALAASPAGVATSIPDTDLFLARLTDGRVAPLVQQPGWDREPAWSHDGRRLAFISQRGRLDWTYACVVGLLSPDDGAPPTYIGEDLDERLGSTPAQPWWSADDASVIVSANYHLGRHLFAIDAQSGRFTQMSSGDAFYAHVSPSLDARSVAVSAARVDAPSDLLVATVPDMRTRQVATIDPGWRAHVRPVQVKTIEWPSQDARFIVHGVLILPPDYRSDRRYPVIVFAAGGPSMIRLGFNLDEDVLPHLALAARGYVVFVPNTRGRRGYGKAFRQAPADAGHVFAGPYDDLMRGLDKLNADGILQEGRVALAGFSYGGSLAAFAMTKTDRFKAAVIQEGFPNYLRMVLAMAGRADDLRGLHEQLGLSPVWDPGSLTRLIAHSPILSMDRVGTPTLLLYGQDGAAKTDGIDWLRALRQVGVPARLRVYPRTGHVISEPALLMDSFDQSTAWFERWMKPDGH